MELYSKIYEKMLKETATKQCPECGGTMEPVDSEVLVCKSCNFSADIEDYQNYYLEKLLEEEGFYDQHRPDREVINFGLFVEKKYVVEMRSTFDNSLIFVEEDEEYDSYEEAEWAAMEAENNNAEGTEVLELRGREFIEPSSVYYTVGEREK